MLEEEGAVGHNLPESIDEEREQVVCTVVNPPQARYSHILSEKLMLIYLKNVYSVVSDG